MINSINNVSATTPQTAFKRKGAARHELHAFIDESNKIAMELLNKDRPLAEKRDAFIRDSLLKLRIKDSYIGKIIERGKASIEHIRPFKKHKASDKYEKWIIDEVKAGHMDADQAISLLANHGLLSRIVFKLLK